MIRSGINQEWIDSTLEFSLDLPPVINVLIPFLAILLSKVLFIKNRTVLRWPFWIYFLIHLSEKSSPFIWGIIFFCTMDGFSRILEKKLSKLLCTRLYRVLMMIRCSFYVFLVLSLLYYCIYCIRPVGAQNTSWVVITEHWCIMSRLQILYYHLIKHYPNVWRDCFL